MYLVMMNEKPTNEEKQVVTGLVGGRLAEQSYDGESTKQIQENLKVEAPGTVIVTADPRFLKFASTSFELKDIYLYEANRLEKLENTTIRLLRPGHNLMNLFESGEFSLQTAIKSKE